MKITQKKEKAGLKYKQYYAIINYLMPNLFLVSHMCYVKLGACEGKIHLQENKTQPTMFIENGALGIWEQTSTANSRTSN
jgi:hypothetical protein